MLHNMDTQREYAGCCQNFYRAVIEKRNSAHFIRGQFILAKSKKRLTVRQTCPKLVSNDFFFSCAPEANIFVCLLDSSCSWNQFACSAQKCISKHWICDGEDDCGDGLDESDSICGELFLLCSHSIFRHMIYTHSHFRTYIKLLNLKLNLYVRVYVACFIF